MNPVSRRVDLRSIWNWPHSRSSYTLVLLGLIPRIVLLPIASQTYDVSVWYTLSNDLLRGLGIYSSHTYTYPPLWALTIMPLLRLLALAVNPIQFGQNPDRFVSQEILPGTLQPVVSPLFLIFLKLPLLLADLGGGYCIYRIVSELVGRSRGKAALALWLLSPSIIWTSFGHGQFDVIPAVLTLLSAYLLYRREWISSGISLSLATLYKLYPLFFIPLYIAGILATRSDGKPWQHHLVRFMMGLMAPGIVFIFVPLSLPPAGASFINILSARGELISNIGGFSPFNVLNLPLFFNLRQSLILNSGLANLLILAMQSTLSVLIAWHIKRLLVKDWFSGLLYGHVFVLVMIFLTLPATNPQYIVWIMPFLTLLYGLKGVFLRRSWLLSVAAFLINLFWLGPGYFFYPSAIYLGAPSVAFLASMNSAFMVVALPAVGICQIAGIAGIVSCLKPSLGRTSRWWHSPKELHHSEPFSLNPKLPLRMQRALELTTIFLIASLVFSAINTQPTITIAPTLTISDYSSLVNSTHIRVQARLQLTGGTYPAEVDSLFLPLRALPRQPPVYVYYDTAYPPSLTDLRGWKGVTDHLPFELAQRHYPSNVTTVDAQRLAQLLASDPGNAIVIPSGTLPSTTNVTALKSFLERGGTLFWLGDRIGYYITGPSLWLDRDSLGNPRYGAQLQLFNGLVLQKNTSFLDYSIGQIRGPYFAADMPTNLSSALNLNYPATTVGVDIFNLTKIGGTALGRINAQTSQTSLALISFGFGKLILFGGGVSNQFATSGETTISADIAQILAGGLLDSTLAYAITPLMLDPFESLNASIVLSLITSERFAGILLLAYSPYPYIHFFAKAIYPP